MYKLLFVIIIFIANSSYGDTFLGAMGTRPSGFLTINHKKNLNDPKEQISCQHLRFRYKELEKILKDMSWLSSLNPYENPGKINAHEYIKNRLQANPDIIASRFTNQIEVFMTNELMKSEQSPVEAIGILGAANFELFFPEDQKGEASSISKKENGLLLTLQINAYDICSKSYLDIFVLKGCPKNQTEEFNCGELKCPASLTYDWQSCTDTTVYRVNLKAFENKLGLRKREIRWMPK